MNMEGTARQRFLEEYRQIRYAEGRGSDDPEYYRALPFVDLSGRNTAMWEMRGKTFRYFETHILMPLERRVHRPLDILDLGAGNCWLSYRLALRRHSVCAVDIFLDSRDGLSASRHYDVRFPAIGAEFDYLPFQASSVDLAIFNSSLHYSTGYHATLAEALRCLRPDGRLVVLDSPIYSRRAHGEQMVAERHADFERRYGFRSDAVPSIEFLDEPRMRELADSLHLRWTRHRPWYGWRWHTRPMKAMIHRKRPPSRFWIFVGHVARP
jgi:SAM-dependent methyltransferase